MKTNDTAGFCPAEILESAARAFWACAWSDYQDESPDGENLSGVEILDVLPEEIPGPAWDAARLLARGIQEDWGMSLAEAAALAAAHPDRYADRPCDAEHFGHYLAMQAMGHGVGIESVCNRDAMPSVPYVEHSWCDYPESIFPAFDNEEA